MIWGKIFLSTDDVQSGSPGSCSAPGAGDPDRCDVFPVFFPFFGGYFPADAGDVKPIPGSYHPRYIRPVWQWFNAGGKPSYDQSR